MVLLETEAVDPSPAPCASNNPTLPLLVIVALAMLA